MTVPATTRRAGPFTGNGVTTSFPFTFKVFETSDIQFTTADADGLETARVLGSDYSVTLNPDQDASPGGSVTYPISGTPLAVGHTAAISGAVEYTQELDLPGGGSFSPTALENALDRTTMQVQQLQEELGRSLTLPVTAAGASTELPVPEAGKVIAWNSTGTGLVNVDSNDLASVVVAGTSYTDVLNGTGAQTAFTLTVDPGSANALDVAISGVSQVNGVDFTVSGTTLTFTTAPPSGVGNVAVRYVAALPVGTANAQDVAFLADATGAALTDLAEWIAAQDGYNPVADFGALTSGADQTSKVQLALNALPADGGTVKIPRGCKFNPQSLTFPQRSNLEYWMDDDLSRPNPSTTLGTNERVMFAANANASGIVNEWRMTASFHPAMVVDVRRDVAGHDGELGAGQVRVPTSSNPARASWNILDQQVDAYRTAYEIFGGDYSLFSGVTSHGWRRTVTITGVGTGAGGFVSVPAVGTEVTGSVSGAKGWFLSATTTTTTLLWNSGKFAASDRLADNNETTVNTASSVAFAIEPLQSFGQDLRRGNWSFGLPVGAGTDLLSVGGRVALLPTRTFSQYVDKTITHPGLVLSDLVSDVPTNGFVIHYDTTAAAASRRLTVRKISGAVEATTDSAHVNACRAHCNFGNAGGVSTSAFNVASVTRTGTGRYDIVFTRAMERDDYSVSVSLEEASTKGGYPLSKTTAGFTLAVATLGGTTAVDLAAAASVVVFGGDI